MTAGLWARLAAEVSAATTFVTEAVAQERPSSEMKVAPVEELNRCRRCGAVCAACTPPPPDGWGRITVRPGAVLDEDALRAALVELEPPVDEPGVRRTRPVARGSHGHARAQASPAVRRAQPVQRPTGGAR